ncbi:hypothetical protein [Kordia jejudonensis]|uniref:hypothetical protein n=1 Tax=Kordia jejudonensis TaxID=1348245 RepID=UPI00062956E4|nr:hypothetical protein [Kordia jejudonensis]
MILIYNNRGILIPVFFAVPFLGVMLLIGALKSYINTSFSTDCIFEIGVGIGLIISSVWTYFTSFDYVMNNGQKEKIEMNHHFFYISNRLWSYIMLVIGILVIISGIFEFFFD